MDSAVGTEAHGGARRSAPELATLLLELARLVKARRYYGPGDARLATVFERCLRGFTTDLARAGALMIEIGPQGFREAGSQGVLTHERLAALHRELGERGIHSITFEPELDGEAFAGFAEVLASDAGLVAQQGGFSAMLAARVPFGIQVVEAPNEAIIHQGAPLDDAADSNDSPTEPLIHAPSDELGALLMDLGHAETATVYADLARRASTIAERAFDNGDTDGFIRAVRGFADHVEEKRSEQVADMANSFLNSLTSGQRLEHLIDLATADTSSGIDAMRTLMLLGDDTVRGVVGMATTEADSNRRDALFTVALALGDRILPPILDLLGHEDPHSVRGAARLAGATQHPAAVRKLADLLHHPEPGVREETAKALSMIGSDEAIAALARASRSPETVKIAVQGLTATHSARALPPLENVLERAIDAKDVELAKEVIRALGRMTEPAAARPLAALLQRRARLQRWLRDLKVAAISALGQVPGDEAVGALAQAAQFRDAQMRQAAQLALDRRAGAHARG
jgi:HEAT repeat protein